MQKSSHPLKIVQVAPLWFTIPPRAYGGIERIVALLCDGLVKRGHDVTLFASPGSKTLAKLVSVYPQPLIEAGMPWSDVVWNLRNISQAYARTHKEEVDIVHCHMDFWGVMLQANTSERSQVVHTLHNPLRRSNADASARNRIGLFSEEADKTNVVFISDSAKKDADMNFVHETVVLNAVDTDHFAFSETPKDHFVWIARMDKHKGIENAIAAAEAAGVKLHLAGRIDPVKQPYFDEVIKPHLNDKIQYVGEVAYPDLPKFYGESKGLIYPIEWEEPFGLVVAEAMSCGTPVIAYDRGAMSQLIEDGVSGRVVKADHLDGVISAIKEIDQIDRKAVRDRAVAEFGADRMVDEYEAFYRSLLQ